MISLYDRKKIGPLSRKDIFYCGSIYQLPEFQSQPSLYDFRQSMVSIQRNPSLHDQSGAISAVQSESNVIN